MLCVVHQLQESIDKPDLQFSGHMESASLLLKQKAYAEAEGHLRCAFELFERGLVPETASVISCFTRLMSVLESQQKKDLIPLYLEKGLDLSFSELLRQPPMLHVVPPGQTEPETAAATKWLKEVRRLNAVRRYEILDTPNDGCFDRLTQLASKVFNMPIVIISLVDTDRIWFKSHHGLDGVEQIGRAPGLCASAILTDDIYLVEDARNDPRTLTNPLVCGEFGLQFYAAAPLKTHDGHNLGTFCVIDKKQRYLNTEQDKLLADFAAITMDEMEIRLAARNTAAACAQKLAELEGKLRDKV